MQRDADFFSSPALAQRSQLAERETSAFQNNQDYRAPSHSSVADLLWQNETNVGNLGLYTKDALVDTS